MKLRARHLCAALMLLLFAARAAARTIDAEVLPAELSVREMTALSESAFAIANGAKAMDACRTLILHVAGLLVREKGATRNDALDFNYRLTYSPESDCTWLVEMGFGPDNHVRYRIDRGGAISGLE